MANHAKPYTRREMEDLLGRTPEGARLIATVEHGFAPEPPTPRELAGWAGGIAGLSGEFNVYDLGSALALAREWDCYVNLRMDKQGVLTLDYWAIKKSDHIDPSDIPQVAHVYHGPSFPDAALALVTHLYQIETARVQK